MAFGADRALRASVQQVAAFWAWWADSGRTEALRMLDTGDHARFVREVDGRTTAIDRRLTWHTEPGATRPHRLILSAAGAIEARSAAERWRRAAPKDDLWEFAASRTGAPPSPDEVLTFAGRTLQIDAMRFTIEERRRSIDVRVGHPAFADLDDGARMELAFLLLDLVIGEDDVERCIGHIGVLAGPAIGGITAAGLRDAVRTIASDDAWVLVEATHRDRSTAILQIGPRLHPLDHLPFDRHTTLELRYRPRADGLADTAELQRVQVEQTRFEEALGASAVAVVTEMHAGVRTVHLYSDGADRNAVDAMERLAHGRRDIRVRHDLDPAWRAVAEYRGI